MFANIVSRIINLVMTMIQYKKASSRGRTLENCFERIIDHLNTFPGVIAVRLEVKRIGVDIYKAQQPCDFIVDTGTTVWYLDTKECSSSTWYQSKAPAQQVYYFKKAQAMGRRAGFVIWFRQDDPAMVNLRFIEQFDESATITSGSRFDWSAFLEDRQLTI